MTDREEAIRVFRLVNDYDYPCSIWRRRPRGAGDPVLYTVCIQVKEFSGRELWEVIKLAESEDLDLGVAVKEGKPELVLS